MTGIIPRSKAKGTDICEISFSRYIIRSDLGCFMKTSDLNKGSDISIFSLHPSCRNGDHYLGGDDGYFYVIKGDSYRRVKDLMTDHDAKVLSLHPNCQGGDHYFSYCGYFFIIFQGKDNCRMTKDLNKDSDAVEYDLPPDCRNGLYYWGLFCFLKPASKWGIEFCCPRLSNLPFFTMSFTVPGDHSVHPDVVNFLPGGLALNRGPAFGKWENIKNLTNTSNTTMTYTNKINKKVGYNKEKMTEITHNWKIGASVTSETGDLAKLIAKVQFTFSTEYGGSHVNTDKESWDEATEVEEQLSFQLKPNESVYLWQFKLGIGEDPVLFCRDLKIARDPNPPTEVPLACIKS